MRRILITGSNRGVGLALVQKYLEDDNTLIFATCRNPAGADKLQALAAEHAGRVHVLELNVIDQAPIEQSVAIVRQHVDGLDMLINNAAILPGGVDNREKNIGTFGFLEADAMLHVFRVNSVAPIIIAQAYADLLRNGTAARVINVSSDAGSINRRNHGCDYSYPSSKAALNMLSRCLAGDLRADSIIVISLHPGFIKTDMGGVNARMTLDEAIPGMAQVIDGLTLDDSGQFFNWAGQRVEW
jgi:NAD(P)-dependent dehydrogenase (short-subunit alcohol dehydrogenase family)